MLKSAGPPTCREPTDPSNSSFSVEAGFLVQATNAVRGSIPNLWVTKLPTKGNESVWQLGLKSVAKEKIQLFSIQFLGVLFMIIILKTVKLILVYNLLPWKKPLLQE